MIARMARRWWGVGALAGALAGCDFESDAGAGIETNTCITDAECSDDTRCEAGMCVARTVESPLAVVLEVTPAGSTASPYLLDRFVVEGPLSRTWDLAERVTVSGDLRGEAGPIDAEVRFVPMHALRGVTMASVIVPTGDGDPPGRYRAEVVPGMAYRMEVDPVARELPPVRREVQVEGDEEVDIDYGEIEFEAHAFEVRGAQDGATVLVRALEAGSDAVVSSTAQVDDGMATILLAPDAGAFRVEVSVDEAYQEIANRTASPAACDASAPAYPTFLIDEAELPRSRGMGILDLPAYPERIAFSGTVELCDGSMSGKGDVTQLPVALRSTEILLDAEDTSFRGTFGATTTAEWKDGQLRFCVEVVPGSYEVVVTPPSSMECAIFAETRLVSAPAGENATGMLFELPVVARLTGTLQTAEGMPVAGATIEAQALGRNEGVQLAEGDPSVTRYNRSQQTTSEDDGSFALPVDLGGYDIVVKPPAESGFPWRVLHDVNIGARDVEFASVIDVVSPVRIDGTLRFRNGRAGDLLAGAEVRAYAVIDDEFDTERAVPVGKVAAGEDGRFMLLLPPSTRAGWYAAGAGGARLGAVTP
jgi:hypothetical protein